MTAARVVSCGASGIEEKQAEWAPLDPGDDPSEGARLALLGGEGGVAVLLVELEAGGLIAEHATPEVAVCHVIEGSGTVFFPYGDEFPFERGDTLEFAGDVVHGWRGGRDRTLLAVTTYPEPRGRSRSDGDS
jgi:quercetin dioxygenase-like cupin family protein